jgi:hypothetical protein
MLAHDQALFCRRSTTPSGSNPNTRCIISPKLVEDMAGTPGWEYEAPIMVSEDVLADLISEVLSEYPIWPYHSRTHIESVLARVERLAFHAGLDAYDTQILKLGALFHDYDHCGFTLRQVIQGGDWSNEEVSAYLTDLRVSSLLTVRQRVILQGLILATAFGQRDEAGLKEKYPTLDLVREYRPFTDLERLLAFADVNQLEGTDEERMRDDLSVLRESLRHAPAPSFERYVAGRAAFLAYLATKVADVKPLLSEEYGDHLERCLEIAQNEVKLLADVSDPHGDVWRRAFYEVLAESSH